MALITPFGGLGDSFTPPENETYLGVVMDNQDPLKLGRIKVYISMYEDVKADDLPWCYPLLHTFLGNSKESIMFSVPEEGSEVRVSFPTRDKYAPYYSGCELNSENKCTFFDDDYPDCYGFKDSVGNFVKVNKKTKTTTIQHSSTTNVEIVEDGTTTLTMPEGTVVQIDSIGNIVKDDVSSEGCNSNGFWAFKNPQGAFTIMGGSLSSTGEGPMECDHKVVKFMGSTTADSLSAKNGISGMFPLMDGRVLFFADGILVGVSD